MEQAIVIGLHIANPAGSNGIAFRQGLMARAREMETERMRWM